MLFYCETPAAEGCGGESVLADVREILPKLDQALVQEFCKRGCKYHYNWRYKKIGFNRTWPEVRCKKTPLRSKGILNALQKIQLQALERWKNYFVLYTYHVYVLLRNGSTPYNISSLPVVDFVILFFLPNFLERKYGIENKIGPSQEGDSIGSTNVYQFFE